MQRALVTLVLVGVAACRMNFDPVDDTAGAEEAGESIESTQMASTITAEPGSDLSYRCMAGTSCMVDCADALSCIVNCAGTTTCDVLCPATGCIVNNCTAPSCEVDCGLGQKTVINDTHFCSDED